MLAKLYGVGVGPGDPELLTLKAVKTISSSDILCYVANDLDQSIALDIVKPHIPILPTLMPVILPMNTDRQFANLVYDETTSKISKLLTSGKTVTMICEGDPLFYGSFTYVLERLNDTYPIEIIPGISSIHSAAASLKFPLCTQLDRQLTITARSTDAEIVEALRKNETVAILKAGADRQRIKTLIQSNTPTADAMYAENIGRKNELLVTDLTQLPSGPGGYFSLFLVRNSNCR